MNAFDFCVMEDAAWSAFYSVLKAHGLTELQVSRFRMNLDNKDCYNDVSDQLHSVVRITDD